MNEELLTYEKAAALLGLKMGTIYALVSQKRIPHVRLSGRVVRFRRTEIERWIRAQTVNEKKKG